MNIIGISGNAGVGKDYLTKHILAPMISNGQPYIIASFADHFKIDSIVKDNLDRTKVYGKKDSITRSILQQKGTENGRDIYGNDVWVNILHERLLQYSSRGIKYFFITDCRFENEIQYVKSKNGIVIRIEAEDRHNELMSIEGNENKNHSSETSLSKYTNWDYIIDNSKSNSNVFEDSIYICCLIQEHFIIPETIFYNVNKGVKLSEDDYKKHIVFICDKYTFVKYIQTNNLDINLYNCENTTDYEYLMEKYISKIYRVV